MTRRTALKFAAAAGAAGLASRGSSSEGAVLPVAPPDAVGLLYDTTLCIGCKTCVVACQDANGLPRDPTGIDARYDAPVDLSPRAKNVIKLYSEGDHRSFVKVQCMHCLDPACATACMLGAFKKREYGIVTYDVDLCVGCRYCEVACPYGVPKFEWASATPRMVKCELCNHRLAKGQQPACSEVCPRKAVIFGRREDLLKEAKRRLQENPARYVPKVYGETDGGGTQVLYISHVPFDKLGFPPLTEEPSPSLARSIQHGVYKGFVAPAALYAALGAVMLRNRKKTAEEE